VKKFNKKKLFFGLFIFSVLTFVYLPLIIVMAFSFTEGTTISFQNFEFSLQLYRDLFENDRLIEALLNTLIIAGISALLATVIGTMACVGMMKMKKRARGIMMAVNLIPLVNATIVTGFMLMLLYSTFGMIEYGYIRLILAHTLIALPIVILVVLPKLRGLDQNVFEAAQDLGATPSQAFFSVMIPMLFSAMLGAFLVGITLSVDEFVITNYNNHGVATLPTLIYQGRSPAAPEFRALSTIVFFTVIVILIALNIRMARKEKRKKLQARR